MNYAQYLEKGKTIESTESLIEKVINSQGQDENALQELVNRAQSQDSKAIEFLQMLQQQSGVSKFEKPSGPIVKKDQQEPNTLTDIETGTIDGRKYTYYPYQGEGQDHINRFEYIGQDGNTYGMTIQGPDTTYVMNGQQYNDPEGQRVIKERRAAVVREKCGGSVKKKETGDKITRKKMMAKGGCPCMIQKVGGRLIEVDSCTGLPVHKQGNKIQYAKFGDGIKKFFNNWADAAERTGANFTPGAGSIAGSIVDGTPSGIVGSPAQESTEHNGVENQNNRMTYQTFDNWLQENAPEYRDPSKRAELFHKYGLGSVSMYNRGKEQNMALWNKMKADKAAGVEFGGPQIDTNYSPTLTVNEMTPPVIQYPQSGSRQDESLRNAAIAQMSGKRISNRERRKWGEAYDALQSGANPNDLTNIQKLRIQRMGKALRTPTAKNGGQLNYANYLN